MKIVCLLFGWHRYREMTGGTRNGVRLIFWDRCTRCGETRMRKG